MAGRRDQNNWFFVLARSQKTSTFSVIFHCFLAYIHVDAILSNTEATSTVARYADLSVKVNRTFICQERN